MASLWKRKKSPYWVACYTGADGRQLKRSTKKRNRNDAMVTCLEWERAEKHAREGNFSEAQARKVLGDILEKTTGERLTVLTIRKFLENWVDSKEVTKATGTSKRYRHTVDEFLKHLGERANAGLQSLRPAEIESFRDLQVSDGKSAATANMVLKTLRIPLNLARRQGLIFTNPAEAVESPPIGKFHEGCVYAGADQSNFSCCKQGMARDDPLCSILRTPVGRCCQTHLEKHRFR